MNNNNIFIEKLRSAGLRPTKQELKYARYCSIVKKHFILLSTI